MDTPAEVPVTEPAKPFVPDLEAIAKLQARLDELHKLIAIEERAQAKGRRQVPRRLPTVPAPYSRWEGSFWGIPVDWADDLIPTPPRIKHSSEPVQEWSAMRILAPDKIKDDGIWVKRGGSCKCFVIKAFVGLPGYTAKKHPYYAKCWKQRMVKLPPKPKDNTPVARWHRDKRNPWGGYYVDAQTLKKIGGVIQPIRKVYAAEMSPDDRVLQQQETRGKWAMWISQPSKQKKVKPEVTLAHLRAARFMRLQILQLKQDVLTLSKKLVATGQWQDVLSLNQ